MLGGKVIGLPPVLNFGSPELKARIIPDILAGKKFICLAISEAQAGSDVMGLQTTAKLSEDGKEWIINGTKKWITNATYVEALCLMMSSNAHTILQLDSPTSEFISMWAACLED